MKIRLWYCLFLFAFCTKAYSQLQVDICENKVPLNWKVNQGKLSMSNVHYKFGKQSVKWNWTKNTSHITIKDEALQSVLNDPRSTFAFWLYNDKAVKDHIEFVFYNGNKEIYTFNFELHFKGWRTAWVMYHRDMTKLAHEGIDRLVIKAPQLSNKGSLYIDQLISYVNINPRSPMRDLQVPFVNLEGEKAANAHWNSLYKFNATKGYLPLANSISEKDKKQFSQITNRYLKLIAGKKIANEQARLTTLKKELAFWDIKKNKGIITGRTIFSVNDIELTGDALLKKAKAENETSNIKRYAELLLNLAHLYAASNNSSIKEEIALMYIDLLDNMEEQGWAYGSGMGALHHLGYNLAGFYNANLIMKDVIKQSGRLDRTAKAMSWFSGLGRMLEEPAKLPVSNIDVFNTLLGSMLASVLVLDDGPEKLGYLQHFSKWMSHNVQPDTELTGAFKPDGAVFHHATLYPAYGVGGYTGLAPIIYALSKTQFQIDADAHQSFKDNMLTMHYYTNPTRWPISISGRHPTGNWRIPDMPFAYLALCGTPDGKEKVDKDMAAVYLLVNKNPKSAYTKQFKALGIAAAVYPEMHKTLNFGLLDIHRRQDWLLTIKGHNRYIVSHESYPNANVFGRYSSYGQLEVLYPESKKDIASNFNDNGWDWNRLPGTTTLHVPLDYLRADIKNVDDYSGVEEMLISEELFAGGVNLNKQGVFAMKLKGHDKYKMGSFKATKSWFTFDSIVVALGSDITNDIKEYQTETTLFQNYLNTKQDAIAVNGVVVNAFPYIHENAITTVLDNRNIGYYLPKPQKAIVYKQNQQSRDQKDLKDTQGDFTTLYINHGANPKNEGYDYAMLINTDSQKLNAFAKQMQSKNAAYTVLQKDSIMHSVKYHAKEITGLSIFKANEKLKDKYVLTNDKPCLVMYKEQAKQLDLAVVNPDLAFYEGEEDSPKNADGTRKEVSIYSKSWYKSPAKPTVLKLTLKGKWQKVDSGNTNYQLEEINGNTILTIQCKYGLSNNMSIKKG